MRAAVGAETSGWLHKCRATELGAEGGICDSERKLQETYFLAFTGSALGNTNTSNNVAEKVPTPTSFCILLSMRGGMDGTCDGRHYEWESL